MAWRYTLATARRIRGPIVYGLVDQAGTIFYIGKTRDAKRRFWDHSERPPHNPQLRKRMESAGKTLRVVVIARDPPNLAQAEMDEIAKRCLDLVNVVGNPFRRPSGFQIRPNSRETLGLCPGCDGRLDKPRMRLCSTCMETNSPSMTVRPGGVDATLPKHHPVRY